jgi:GrpB-like predicted nucleotidyltransferase (UPF0157 family)
LLAQKLRRFPVPLICDVRRHRFNATVNVTVVAHDPSWAHKFEREAEVVRTALGAAASTVRHIGSTAIPGIYAKPIIDMLVEVTSLEAADKATPALVAQGCESMGEFGLPGRRYFRKNDAAGVRDYQIHAYAVDSPELERHLAFRDYLRSHSDAAEEYSQLKCRLARQYPSDIEAYTDGKDPFIKATEEVALAWSRRRLTKG